jgi:hypothetical protein
VICTPVFASRLKKIERTALNYTMIKQKTQDPDFFIEVLGFLGKIKYIVIASHTKQSAIAISGSRIIFIILY